MKLSRGLRWVLMFTVAYLAAAVVAAVMAGNREFIFYITVMVVLIAIVAVVHARVKLTIGVLWLLSLWGAAHMAGGLVTVPDGWPTLEGSRVLYNWWIIPDRLKYDQVVHAYGFATSTWLCWQCLRNIASLRRPTIGAVTLAALGAMGLGALNEVVEFIATLIADTNVGGYVNTGWDLVANTVGATFAATLIYLLDR